jgi:UPF0755 protein
MDAEEPKKSGAARNIVFILLGLVVLAALAAVGFWTVTERRISEFAEVGFGTPETKVIDIPPGTNPKGVAVLLAKAGVISDADLGYGYLRREKLGPKLKAGEYEFAGPLSPTQVIEKIIKGDVKQYRFTVPEGLRVDEVLPLLANSELKLSLEKLNELAKQAGFAKKLGVPADSLEGFLHPDTYSFPKAASEEMVLKKMVSRTLEEFKNAPRKAGMQLDLLQSITLASIVEKETGAAEERPRISCVFSNRLRLGMKLQTDPTVIYAKFLRTGTYNKNITRADLTAEHAYNTYTMKGLPPGPIAGPGALAIRASLNPLICDDLFFVSKNDGTHVFCPDLKCHEANVQKWQVEFFKKKHD